MSYKFKVGEHVLLPKYSDQVHKYLKQTVGCDSQMIEDMRARKKVRIERLDKCYYGIVAIMEPDANGFKYSWPADLLTPTRKLLVRG